MILIGPTDSILTGHAFKHEFEKHKGSLSPIRNCTISKHIAKFATGFPGEIFVQVAEARMDVLRILMIGVKDTPYANALFPFDMYIPKDYPNSPPKIHCVLPGLAQCDKDLNPNIYPDGHLCLSVLNTWKGHSYQMWRPENSTLSQVLVSIHSMILGTPEPYLNEPGRNRNATASNEYNLEAQWLSLKWGLIPWVTEETGVIGLW